ncbi:MAG: hypothetical protein ACP5U0_07465 [Caldisphaera sp.]
MSKMLIDNDFKIENKAILNKFNYYLSELKKLPNFVRYKIIEIDNDFKLPNEVSLLTHKTLIRLNAYFRERIDEGLYRYVISQITLIIDEQLNMSEEILNIHDELIKK